MRITVETATDVAAVAVGDPTLLTGLRGCKGRGFERQRDEALSSGAMWRAATGADGAYLIHVYVDEEPASAIRPHLHDAVIVARLRIPTGRLLVAGEEIFVGALSMNEYPHMGQEVRVPAGDYQMTALRSEAADHLLHSRFEEQATAEQRRAWALGNRLAAVCVVSTLAALVAGYVVYLRTASSWTALSPLLGAVGLWFWRGRHRASATYEAAERLYRAVERELPSIVVILKRLGPAHQADAPDSRRPRSDGGAQ